MNACCSGCSVSPLASPSTVRSLPAVGLDREHQAGADRLAVEDHRAGAADAVLAADMGAGLAAVVADGIDQRLARLDADVVRAAVDGERDVDFVTHQRGRTSLNSRQDVLVELLASCAPPAGRCRAGRTACRRRSRRARCAGRSRCKPSDRAPCSSSRAGFRGLHAVQIACTSPTSPCSCRTGRCRRRPPPRSGWRRRRHGIARRSARPAWSGRDTSS